MRTYLTLRSKAEKLMRLLARLTICKICGHYSTGTLLWWMCDRCHADFAATALPSSYINGDKVTRSDALGRKLLESIKS